ncbi:transcriptional regulator, TetR family [Streptoalloteichus tenebrarius]|uniref:Transcriptional regulator, TetR family n=1 Tax=Streptoalloteichus tenebrarius (strain ATCC 17920 / DSM 40477 / JCM 4838 / CBS 697.72 / NBRC 16177 / NCIMB 11028 / NRRL B-12390 / A12253. 1 / ISP 5477) TaxID=1933 RepID=A0ABT1I036_STRSD|nr:TetR/AcrR family transcriptional regulator [Streptoalloteichus tenebrarius]MCP2261149.1 transcriptional regulator, TetR family [Streptoalloteichus tenebrarius]BFF03939.1 TetR/AcrR family transcriptional regulator [Streptoalloteichus tenebrarius]
MTGPDRRRPLRADARRNYDRVLAQAAIDFAEHGADVSLDDIARRAGVGSATLYRHFPSRDALLAEVIRGSVEGLRAEAERLLGADDAGEALRTWLRAATVHATSYRGLSTSLMSSFYDEGSPLHESCRAMHAAGGALLARAQESGSVRRDLSAEDLFTLVNALAWAAEWNGRAATVAPTLLDVVFNGVREAKPR